MKKLGIITGENRHIRISFVHSLGFTFGVLVLIIVIAWTKNFVTQGVDASRIQQSGK